MRFPSGGGGAWRPSDLSPELARVFRAVVFLALVGAAVMLTGQIMRMAQRPARNLLGVN